MLKFIRNKYDFFLGGCTVAWGVGFLRYIGNGYWFFPWFPNLLDVLGLFFVGSYLIAKSVRGSTPISASSSMNRNPQNQQT